MLLIHRYCLDTELTDKDSYVILACDGVWDVMTDQYAVSYVLEQIAKLEPQLQAYLAEHGNSAQTSDSTTTSSATHEKIESDVVMSYADNEAAAGEHGKVEDITTPKNWNDLLYLVCKALVQEALDKRSLDNVTVLIVRL